MGFTRQEYWGGLPFPSPGDLPNLGIEPRSSALQADSLTSEPPGKLKRPLLKDHHSHSSPPLRVLKWFQTNSTNSRARKVSGFSEAKCSVWNKRLWIMSTWHRHVPPGPPSLAQDRPPVLCLVLQVTNQSGNTFIFSVSQIPFWDGLVVTYEINLKALCSCIYLSSPWARACPLWRSYL